MCECVKKNMGKKERKQKIFFPLSPSSLSLFSPPLSSLFSLFSLFFSLYLSLSLFFFFSFLSFFSTGKSCFVDGQNTTDMTFFAIAPKVNRPPFTPYSSLPPSAFVPFPAVRAPNYFDTIDVLPSTQALTFLAKNRAGLSAKVTLMQFLTNIG